MTTALTIFNAQVDILIETDADIIATADVNEAIKAAVERYSKDAPDTSTEDVAGDAGRFYALGTVLDNWTEGFSRIESIEYPAAAVASDETPVYLDAEDWRDDFWAEISTVQTRHLYLPNHAPAATETMRITYTLPYLWTGSPPVTTTPTGDFYAICHLAAGLACQTLAAKFAQSKDSTIAVDSATHASKSSARQQEQRLRCTSRRVHRVLHDAYGPRRGPGDQAVQRVR
jgi:hypothetical protein